MVSWKNKQEAGEASERLVRGIEENRKKIEAYETLCKEIGEAPANVALAWMLHNPVITSPIIGPRTLPQLTESLRALEIAIEPEILSRLDDIWPGPGGEAPEAYAW